MGFCAYGILDAPHENDENDEDDEKDETEEDA